MRQRIGPLLALLLALTACAAAAGPTATPSVEGPPSQAASGIAPVAGGPERLHVRRMPSRPDQPVLDARFEAGLFEDHCRDRDVISPGATAIELTVLDRTYALPAGYAPPDLVPASRAGLTGTSGARLVRAVLLDDLAAMRAAWDAAGLEVLVDSAYRSHANQAATFDLWEARLGHAGALLRTARPGHSEHQLGTALDLNSPGWGDRFGDWATETAEGAWMAGHGWEYGFVMSYPAGSQPDTCFGYEPWHYRWIGREAAAAHRDSGSSLRDFLVGYIDGE